MENGGGGGVGGANHRKRISAEDVISKLKDDGDFDKLRLKIIRKLKDNDQLRNSIVSMVKQSMSLNRPGAENMKPRQLSDCIHQEIGDKVMSQISDGIWEIIKSGDGMKTEITETVQSVYNKLLKPDGNENGESSSHCDVMPIQKGQGSDGSVAASANKIDDTLSDIEPKEPPGFSLCNLHQNNNNNDNGDDNDNNNNDPHRTHEEKLKEELQLPMPNERMPVEEEKKEPDHLLGAAEPDGVNCAPPGFYEVIMHEQPCDGNDEDPDVPPGFG